MKITLQNPLDMHLHLRDNQMLELVWPLSAQYFSGAIVMPNLVPPVTTVEQVISYKERITKACEGEDFVPFMTLFFHEWLTRETLEQAKDVIHGVKLYPAGITTNSENGAKEILTDKSRAIFSTMQELWIVLNIHWETNDFVMDREKNFIPIYEALAQEFPKLKIIMEHITTKAACDVLDKYENLHATITLQHLLITLDDVAWWMLKPHLFCKPIAKRDEDRDALCELAITGHPKVMFGSDSAPHPQHAKECCGCAAWVFTAPIALQVLVELFEKHDKLDNLEKFISLNAQNIYKVEPIKKEIVLEKKEFVVPEKYWDVVPFMAWEKLAWSII